MQWTHTPKHFDLSLSELNRPIQLPNMTTPGIKPFPCGLPQNWNKSIDI